MELVEEEFMTMTWKDQSTWSNHLSRHLKNERTEHIHARTKQSLSSKDLGLKASESAILNTDLGKIRATSRSILGEQQQWENTAPCILWQCVFIEDIRKAIKTELRVRMWLQLERPRGLQRASTQGNHVFDLASSSSYICYPCPMDQWTLILGKQNLKYQACHTSGHKHLTWIGKTPREARTGCHKEKGQLLVGVQHFSYSCLVICMYTHRKW